MARQRKPVDGGGEGLHGLAAVTVSTGDLAREFGKSPVWIRNLINGGFIPKLAHGKVNRIAAYRGIIAYEEALIAKADERAKASGRARINVARADEITARLEREARGLIDRKEAESALRDLVEIVAKNSRDIGRRLPPGLPRNAVNAEIATISASLEKGRDTLIEALRTGDFEGLKL